MNKYCGPYVYAKLTGTDTDVAAEMLASFDWRYSEGKGKRNGRRVTGVLGSAMREALKATGKVVAVISRPGMTLKTLVEKKAKLGDMNSWAVMITGHFVIMRAGVIYDNFYPHGIPYNDYRGKTKRVKEAICVGLWNDLNPYTGHYHP